MPKLGMREIRRAQLIDATLLTIDQTGLAGATLASVAQRASISTGIVSHYFGDKDGLLEATMRHVLRDLWYQPMGVNEINPPPSQNPAQRHNLC